MTGAYVTSSGEEHRGFHQSPNVLRDIYMKKIGVGGYGYLQYLISWANSNTSLSQRRMMKDLKVSQVKLEGIQEQVLEHCGHFIKFIPGDRVNANRWHLDMRQVWAENAVHMARGILENAENPGVLKINTPPKKPRKGVPEINTPRIDDQYTGVAEINTFKDISKNNSKEGGGAFSFTENAREEAQPTPPTSEVATINPPERTTSERAALQTPTAQAPSEQLTAEVPSAPDRATPEGEDTVTDQDAEFLFGRRDEHVNASEQVPGGAAAARGEIGTAAAQSSELEPSAPVTVSDLSAVPEAELLERVQATSADPVHKAVSALVGGQKKLETLLTENTRSGGLDRERWLRLTLDEVQLVKTTAQAQAKRSGPDGKVTPFGTLSILGLDRLIGAPRLTSSGTGSTTKASVASRGADTSIQDPSAGRAFQVGQQVQFQGKRCQVVAVGSIKIAIDEVESGVGHTVFAKDFRQLKTVD